MHEKDLRIVFMGTPEFATSSLRNLVNNGYNVVATVTAPDKPAGRGMSMTQSDVKKYCIQNNIPILQPEKLKDPQFLNELRKMNPDLFIVVAFRMLPKDVWSLPRLGTFNLHASLLPQYRGAAPINWVVINGESKTGVTTFFIDDQIDTGNIISSVEEPVFDDDTAGSLHDRLMLVGADLVISTVEMIANGTVNPIVQKHVDESELKSAPKIFKEDCRINWDMKGIEIYNFIRGLSPYPTAFSDIYIDKEFTRLKVFASEFHPSQFPGLLKKVEVRNNELIVHVTDGYIKLTNIQKSGKKRMETSEFLRGIKYPQDIKIP